jgi:Mannosyl-glycoprotein endo-beta-N-acetylglucosaminidase
MFGFSLVFFAASFVIPPNEVLTKSAFIERYLPLARQVHKEYGIPVSVCLAQSMHETRAGNSNLAIQAHNFFGMKCKDEGEVGFDLVDDQDTASCFRVYKNDQESFMDYGQRVGTHAIYARVQNLRTTGEKDPNKWVQAIASCGYASSPQYVQLVSRIIKDNNLTKYDQIGPAHYEHDLNDTENYPTLVAASGSNPDFSKDTEMVTEAFNDSITVQLTRPLSTEPAYDLVSVVRIPAPIFERTMTDNTTLIYPSPPMLHPIRVRGIQFQSGLKKMR